MSSRSRLSLAVQRLVVWLGRTPLRPLVVLAYRAIARAIGAYLTWGEREATVYVRVGIGAGDLQPGLSDIDLAILLPDDPSVPGRSAERIKGRWTRLSRRLRLLEPLVDLPRVHERTELEALMHRTTFTYGLGGDAPTDRRAAYFGDFASLDLLRTLEKPDLYESTADWVVLAGRDRRPPQPGRDSQARRLAAWLELVWTWRAVFPFIADPAMPRAASACVKLVCEPARIWLWLAHGERASGRADVLQRALRRLPEEEPALRRALELNHSLPWMPKPMFAELAPPALRLSARVAALIGEQIADARMTEVRLLGNPAELIAPREAPVGGRGGALALPDWRAIVSPELPDESFLVIDADPTDPAVLAGAAAAIDGAHPALKADGLMLMPGILLRRTRLRAIKSPATDPVPFAVADGRTVATLPNVAGWSASDTALRAVAEHSAWLAQPSGPNEPETPAGGGHALGRLLTAARAALLLESVQEGAPELCLTATETGHRLSARSGANGTVADEALGHYREFVAHGAEPPAAVVAAMRELVVALPGYRDAAARTPGR